MGTKPSLESNVDRICRGLTPYDPVIGTSTKPYIGFRHLWFNRAPLHWSSIMGTVPCDKSYVILVSTT